MWLFAIFLTEFSPNPVSPQMEWVELYNDSQNNVDVTGYSIHDSTTSNKQILSGIVPSQSYFTFSFDNNFINNTSSDIIKLYDKNNNLVDSQSSKPIPLGLSFSKQSDGLWCPTNNSPNLANNLCKDSYSLQISPTPVPYISLKIVDLDPDLELITINNPNNFSVELFDWRVVDGSGSSRKLSCTTISPNSNCQATFSSGYLNNDSDKLTLLDPLKREISIYEYDFSKQTTIKSTSTPKPTPTLKVVAVKSPLSKGDLGRLIPQNTISSKSSSSVVINKSSSIANYLSIILMFLGSLSILAPLIFHARFNKK